MNKNKITALYEYLSVSDEQRSGESVSIQNQTSRFRKGQILRPFSSATPVRSNPVLT
jgi:hypothetical protein